MCIMLRRCISSTSEPRRNMHGPAVRATVVHMRSNICVAVNNNNKCSVDDWQAHASSSLCWSDEVNKRPPQQKNQSGGWNAGHVKAPAAY